MIGGPQKPPPVQGSGLDRPFYEPDPMVMDPGADPLTNQQVPESPAPGMGGRSSFYDPDPMVTDVGLPDLIMNDGMGIPMNLIRQSTTTDTQLPDGANVQQTVTDTADPGYVEGPSGMGRGGDQQRGGGFGVKLSAPRFGRELTQEDFYGRQKDFQWNDPRGAVMQMADAGRLPMSIAASRMRQNQTELAAVRKQKQDLLKSWEVDSAPDPYQPSFQKLLSGMQGSFVSGLAEQYGGNEDLAWNEIMNNPKTMAEWENLHKEAEAVGKYGRFIWDESKAYLDRAATGKYHVDPEMLKMAEDVYNGFGNLKGTDGLPNMRQLLASSEKFHRAISREEFVKNFSMPGLKDRYRQWQETNISRNRATNTNVMELRKHYNAEKFLDETAKSMTLAIPGTTLEENKRYLRNVIPPEKIETEVKMLGVPSGGSGGSGGNTGRGTNVRADFRPLDTNVDGKKVAGENTLFFTPFQNTGDKEHTVKEIVVSGGVGSPNVPMRDATLVYRPGRKDWSIVGQSLTEQGRKQLETITENDAWSDEEKERQKELVWSTSRAMKVVPAISNSSVVDTYWGSPDAVVAAAKIAGMKPEEMNQLMQTEAGRAQVAQKMGLPVPGAKSSSDPTFESLKAKLPAGTTKEMWDELTPEQKRVITNRYK